MSCSRSRRPDEPNKDLFWPGCAARPAAGRRLPLRQCPARFAAGGARLCARPLPLHALPQAGREGRQARAARQRRWRRTSPASSRASASRAISSTRRPTTWARRSSKRPRARWRSRHGADVRSVVGDDLLAENFPLIHAVGRAAARAPRLIDLTWGDAGHPKVTLIGKGVCFDTGGLDIKPESGMLNMKKDMGGAACMLALAHMLMDRGTRLRLRVLIPAVENAISGSAFRPRDVYRSRKGLTVEIGNTDAEGRLILADAIALADEEQPELIADMATLTGAARVALGTEIPPFYTDDDALAAELRAGQPVRTIRCGGCRCGDPTTSCSIPRSRTSTTSPPAISAARSPPRCSCAGSCGGQGVAALRHLCLEPDHQARAPRGRRVPGSARALRAAGVALWLSRRHSAIRGWRRPVAGRTLRGRRADGAAAACALPRCSARHRSAQGRARHRLRDEEGWARGRLVSRRL